VQRDLLHVLLEHVVVQDALHSRRGAARSGPEFFFIEIKLFFFCVGNILRFFA
jgi:hypothetical protein